MSEGTTAEADLIAIVEAQLRELDARAAALRSLLISFQPSQLPIYADAIDHLQQIHFRLTECKGHLGAVKHNIREVSAGRV